MGVRVGVAHFYWGQSIGIDETNTFHFRHRLMRFVGVANFFFDQSIGINKTNTFQLNFLSSIKIVGTTDLGGLWTLKWAWQIRDQYISVTIFYLA